MIRSRLGGGPKAHYAFGLLVIVLPETDRFVKGTREAGVHFTLD